MHKITTALLLLLATLLGVEHLYGQAALPIPWVPTQFLNNAGMPLAGGYVYQCVAGASCPGTPQATYTSSSAFTVNANPLQLNGGGFAPTGIWLSPTLSYKFVVTTSGGAVVSVADNVVAAITQAPASLSAGAPTGSVQFNNGSSTALGGSANLAWDNTNQKLTITGLAGQTSLLSGVGIIESHGGYLSTFTGGSWQAFNSNLDGALLRGYSLAQATNNTAGGYIAIAPITYNPYNGATCLDQFGNTVTQPMPLNGLASFATNNVVLWAGTSPSMPASSCGAPLPVGPTIELNTNASIVARGGFATDNVAFNSIQSLLGGASVKLGVTIGQANYFATQSSCPVLNTPAATYGGFGGWLGGANYCYWNGTIWTPVNLAATGGSTTPGAPVNSIQFNSASTFGGSTNLLWDNVNRLVTITALDAVHPGIAVASGFGQFDQGILATSAVCVKFNCIQAPTAGMLAMSYSAGGAGGAGGYVNLGNNGVTGLQPPLTLNDTLNAGLIYWDCGGVACSMGTGSAKIYNGTGFVTLATGGATSPGGSNTYVQYNGAGSFAGVSSVAIVGGQLRTTSAGALAPGIVNFTGDMQSENGFLAANVAVPSTALAFNVIQAPTGGMLAKSFTATNYVQLGNYSSGGVGTAPATTFNDSFHPGACGYDTFGAVAGVGGTLRCFDGANWNAVGGGGGGVAAPVNGIQFNNAGTFGASSNLTWTNGSNLLTINAISGTPAIAIANGGVIQIAGALGGINVTQGTAFNSIQTVGGMLGRSFTASTYVQTGYGASVPFASVNDSFHYGALFYNTSVPALQVCTLITCGNGVGTGWVSLAQGGLSSLNGLTGALNITNGSQGNAITVTAAANTIALTLPQSIGTGSSVTFGSLTTTSGGVAVASTALDSVRTNGGVYVDSGGGGVGQAFTINGAASISYSNQFVGASVNVAGTIQSQAAGAAITFQNSNANFSVNGNGAESIAGVLTSQGGVNVTTLAVTVANSIQTVGGFNAISGGGGTVGNTAFEIAGTPIIDGARNIFNIPTISISGDMFVRGIYHTGASLTNGVTCSGTPTALFATIGGIVTHC